MPQLYAEYASVPDLREAGLSEADAGVDRAHELLQAASLQIDLFTDQWFNPRLQTIAVEHGCSDVLYLPTTLLRLDSVLRDDLEIDPADCVLFNSAPRDWDNPRLRLPFSVDLNELVNVTGLWGVCLQNGVDGNGDPVYVTPEPVRQATIKAAKALQGLWANGELAEGLSAFVISETTDRHSYILSNDVVKQLQVTALPVDAQILLQRFRAPVTV